MGLAIQSLLKASTVAAVLVATLVGCGAPAKVTLKTDNVEVSSGDTVKLDYTALSGFQEEDAQFTSLQRSFKLVSTDQAVGSVGLSTAPNGTLICSLLIFTDWACVAGEINKSIDVKVYRSATFTAEFKDTMALGGLIKTKTSTGKSEAISVTVDRNITVDSILANIPHPTLRACVAAVNAPGLMVRDITTLDCSAATTGKDDLNNMDGIQYFYELKSLNVSGQKNLDLSWNPNFLAFTKLQPLFYLDKLETLNITGIATDQSSTNCQANASTVRKMAEFAPNLTVTPGGAFTMDENGLEIPGCI